MRILSEIKDKYRNLNIQLKVVFWFTLANFIQRGISIITTPVFTRILTPDEFGMFSVFLAWFYILVIVSTFNLHMGVLNNALTKINKSSEYIASAFQSISLIVAILFLLISLGYLDDFAKIMNLPQIVVLSMFVGFIFYEPYNIWMICQRYKYKYKSSVYIAIIISLLSPLISIIAIMLLEGNRGEIRVISYIVVSIVIPVSIFYAMNYKAGRVFYDKSLWKYGVTFNVALIPYFLSEIILNKSDIVMIGSMVDTGAAGIYNIANAAASLVLIFSSALNVAFIPWQYQKMKNKEYSKISGVSYVIFSLVSVLLIVLILFSPEIINLLAGESYMGAVSLVPVLGMSVYFNYMYNVFAKVELYFEKKSYTVIATLIAVIINVVLNYILIPKYGYAGAAYATFLAHILLCIIHYIFYLRVCKINRIESSFYSGKILCVISLVFILCALSIIPLYQYAHIRLLLLTVVFSAVYFFRMDLKRRLLPMLYGNFRKGK